MRAILLIVLVCAGLLYLTFRSAPDSGSRAAQESAEAGCRAEVEARLPGAEFPFSPTVEGLVDGSYRVTGMADALVAEERSRRNYECRMVPAEDGGLETDSVVVWQSH